MADGHSTRELYEEQAESKVLVKKRTPVFHAAARVVEVRELDLSKTEQEANARQVHGVAESRMEQDRAGQTVAEADQGWLRREAAAVPASSLPVR